jgi:hypothetical protein
MSIITETTTQSLCQPFNDGKRTDDLLTFAPASAPLQWLIEVHRVLRVGVGALLHSGRQLSQ